MKWFTKQLYKGKELILGLLGIGISFTAQDIASLIILFGSAFLISMGVLKVLFGIKLPLIKYLEPLIKPLRAIKFAESPTKSGEELGTLIIDVDEKIGGKKMREKIKDFLKNKLVVNKFTNGSFLVIFIALALFIGNQYFELYENVDVSVYLGIAATIATFILRKLKLETNEDYDERTKEKDYIRKQKDDDKAAKLLLKEQEKERQERAHAQALKEVQEKRIEN